MDQYAKDNKLEPTEAELDAYVQWTQQMEKQQAVRLERYRDKLLQELKSPSLSDRDREAKEKQLNSVERTLKITGEIKRMADELKDRMQSSRRHLAQAFVKRWKINQALYGKYGGRVIFQRAGAEPYDAFRDFLREQEKAGAFKIVDKNYEAPFWEYYTNDARHRFYPKAEGAKYINTPIWLMEPVSEK